MHNLFLVLVFLFGLPLSAAAQNVDFAFPSDVLGFRFGDSREAALQNCLSGENYDINVYICHRSRTSIGFDADTYLVFNTDGYVERIWIQSNPADSLSESREFYTILLNDLIDRFGQADHVTNETVYCWSFDELHEEGEINIGFYMIENGHGFFQINFNANP